MYRQLLGFGQQAAKVGGRKCLTITLKGSLYHRLDEVPLNETTSSPLLHAPRRARACDVKIPPLGDCFELSRDGGARRRRSERRFLEDMYRYRQALALF